MFSSLSDDDEDVDLERPINLPFASSKARPSLGTFRILFSDLRSRFVVNVKNQGN